MVRCVNCGSSRLDEQGMRCARCGGAPAVGWEQVYVTEETKKKLRAHAKDLKPFGVTVVEYQPLKKHAGTVMTAIGLGVAVTEAIRPGTLRQVVLFLHQKLRIPEQQIIRLRLDEPENVSQALKPRQTVKKKSAAKKTTAKATAEKKSPARKTSKKH